MCKNESKYTYTKENNFHLVYKSNIFQNKNQKLIPNRIGFFYLSRRFKWQRLWYKARLVAIVKLDLKVETSRLIKE